MKLSILLDLYRSKWKLSDAKEDAYEQPKTALNENDDNGTTTAEMEKLEQSSAATPMMETDKNIITPENTRQNMETMEMSKENEIFSAALTEAKNNDKLDSDEDPKTTHDKREVMEHNTVKYKTVATYIIVDNEDNYTKSELDPLTTITDIYGKMDVSAENYPETGPDTQSMLNAETTTDYHFHATDIKHEKIP